MALAILLSRLLPSDMKSFAKENLNEYCVELALTDKLSFGDVGALCFIKHLTEQGLIYYSFDVDHSTLKSVGNIPGIMARDLWSLGSYYPEELFCTEITVLKRIVYFPIE